MRGNPFFLGAAGFLLVATSVLAEPITFTKDVAPILHQNCVVCHRPGEVAPMSLRTFEEVRPWVRSIHREVVIEKRMPPWHADPEIGHFKNDRRLSADDLAVIDQWVKQGAKRGALEDFPAVPTFEDGWVLGIPDHVITLDEVDIPAEGEDMFINLAAKLDIPEDRWIRAIEILPSDKRAVHHTFAYVSDDGKKVGGKIGSYSVAGGPIVFGDGIGRLVKADQSIVASIHYHPFGEDTKDQMKIGLYFSSEPIEMESVALSVLNMTFRIPAGAKNYKVTAEHTFERDSLITTLGPHMHARGTDMTINAIFPDGRKEKLLLTHWNPSWNIKYELAAPLAAPAGTRLELIAHYDNSADNPLNPDPTKELAFGRDEMMIGFIDYLVPVASSD